MKVLVTGGNGFIGRAVCRVLIARGDVPVVLDPRGRAVQDGALLHLGDIRDATAVTEAAAHAEGIIHLAGVLGTQETIANPLPAADTNIRGGLNVLQAATQYRLPMVNIGVGNWFENNTYSLTKHTVERFVLMFAQYHGIQAMTVRGLNVYGPGQSVAAPYGSSKVRKIAPSFILRALNGDPIEVYGDGGQVMDMIWIDDMARGLVAALDYLRDGGDPTIPTPEVGTGRKTTVLEIAQAVDRVVRAEMGIQATIKHLPMRPGETPGVVVCADTATLAPLAPYGADPATFKPLEAGLKETAIWYYKNYLL